MPLHMPLRCWPLLLVWFLFSNVMVMQLSFKYLKKNLHCQMIFMSVIIVSYRYFLRVTLPQAGYQIDLNASSKWYWPSRTSKTYDLLVQQKIYWAYKFSFNITRKNISLILSILPSFISRTFGDIIEGNYFNKNVPECYWPCRIR